MTIPARLLVDYIDTTHSWPLKDADGKPAGHVDRERFALLVASKTVFGIGSKHRLKYLQMLKPVEEVQAAVVVALKAAYEARMQDKGRRLPNALPCSVREQVGDHYAYKHVAHRCSAAQPFMEPVNAGWM